VIAIRKASAIQIREREGRKHV